MLSTFFLARSKTTSATHFLMETLATSPLLKRKRKLQTNIPVRLACPINAHFKNNVQNHTSLSHFKDQEKMIYKIMPCVFISWLGKNSFTKSYLALAFQGSGKNDLQNHASLFCFLAREKMIYKIIFFCYTITSKGF